MSEIQSARDYKLEAEKLGLIAIVPTDSELQIDLDREYSVEDEILKVVYKHDFEGHFIAESNTKSKSGFTHTYIKLSSELPMIERIALQLILGSDRKRELFNYIRWKKGLDTPICLFEKPEEVVNIAR